MNLFTRILGGKKKETPVFNWLVIHDPDTIIFELADFRFSNVGVVRAGLYIDAMRFLNEKRILQKKQKK